MTWIAPARLALVVLAAGLVAGCGQIVNPPGGHPTPAATSPSARRPSPTLVPHPNTSNQRDNSISKLTLTPKSRPRLWQLGPIKGARHAQALPRRSSPSGL